MKSTLHTFYLKVIFAALILSLQTTSQARIIYVNNTSAGSTDGSSWTNAFNDIQSAIDVAVEGDTICVASGTYLPTHKQSGDSNRNKTFYINKAILLFGGFSGQPGTEGNFQDRNMQSFQTTLSGDVGLPGDHTDNAFHVLFLDHVSELTRIDGFTIIHGYNDDVSFGAGIYNNASGGNSSPMIANCFIQDNFSTESGGGMGNFASEGGTGNPILVNCTFINNTASSGGGIANYTDGNGIANPILINCQLMGNTAPTGQGGAISIISHGSISSPKLINCVVSGNHSPTSSAISGFGTGTTDISLEIYNSTITANTGGSIRVVDLGGQLSRITIRNSILWKNAGNHGLTTNGASTDVKFSIMQFGFDGEGNFSDNPLFVNEPPLQDTAHSQGDLHLKQGSPAIDAGRNSEVPQGITTDLDNLPRFVNAINGQAGIVDLGPYEFQGNTTAVESVLSDEDWNLYPNPARDHVILSTPEIKEQGEIMITDIKGEIVLLKQLSRDVLQHQVDISLLPSGMFFLHIDIDGSRNIRKVVIVSGE